MSERSTFRTGNSGGSGCGCITLIATVFVIWALLFGVTIDGKHYGASCSCERGVELKR